MKYLSQKQRALLDRRRAGGEMGSALLGARATTQGRSGLRRLRVGDCQLVSDRLHFTGYDLGSTSSELQLGMLGAAALRARGRIDPLVRL